MASRPVRVIGVVGRYVLRTLWVSTMVLTPLFGFWLASSLAAYSNASPWLALLVGLLLFPLIPFGWDLLHVWRRSKRPPAKQILTRLDRLVLRTLLVNGLFLGAMLWRAPQTSFRALAVRGDWIVDGHDGPIASQIRGFLLGLADTFEQRWHAGHSDLYGTSDRPPDDDDATRPSPVVPRVTPGEPTVDGWPMPAEPDVQVTGIPASEEHSVEAVGRYLAARITDQRRLVKALHDYVVRRLSYDHATAELRGEDRYTRRPSQQADDVFVARTAVCEGYARLLVALGKAAGVEIAYITGYIRDSERRVDAEGSEDTVKAALQGYLHAWNAAKVDGTWLLVDTTWDDPTGAEASPQSTYLFTPPALFRYDHLPEEPAWQLVAARDVMSAGEFARQPLLSPYAGRLGLVLESPRRSQVSTDDGRVEIVFDNPHGARVLADTRRASASTAGRDCAITPRGTKLAIACELGDGQHEVRVFGQAAGSTSTRYEYVGTILVNSR